MIKYLDDEESYQSDFGNQTRIRKLEVPLLDGFSRSYTRSEDWATRACTPTVLLVFADVRNKRMAAEPNAKVIPFAGWYLSTKENQGGFPRNLGDLS